jgi:hypothetical protein
VAACPPENRHQVGFRRNETERLAAARWPGIRTAEPTMSDDQPTDRSDEARESFEFFSNEYAQALQAYAAIEQQAGTILLLGGAEELLGFIEQFLEMATRTRDLAEERGEQNFTDWFRELVQKAQALRVQVATART